MSALPLWLAGGVVLGLAYFALIRRSAALIVSARGGPWLALALGLLRLGGLAAVLFLAALQGAGPLLAMALGVLAGRVAVMRGAV
jgi:hypothetical protein